MVRRCLRHAGWIGLSLLGVAICTAAPRPGSDQFGIFDVPADQRAVPALQQLGVGWVRVQVRMGESDKDLRPLLREGFGLWLTLYHRDPHNAVEGGTVGFARSRRGGFAVRRASRYQTLVRKTVTPYVEAIRARGRDPGHWLVVQFGNEIMPYDVAPPDKAMRFWHGTADEYLQMLALGYEAVKSVDRNIPVAMGGLSSELLEFCLEEHPRFSAWVERQVREGRYDWLDVHLYHEIEVIPAKVDWVRQWWSGPIAATEVGGPDTAAGAPYSEEAHAEDLPKRLRTALDAGVRRVFWIQLVENPSADSGEPRFQLMSLMSRDGQKKAAFDAYRDLITEWR